MDVFIVTRWVEAGILAIGLTAVVLLLCKYSRICAAIRVTRRAALARTWEILLYHRSPRIVLASECALIKYQLLFLLEIIPVILLASLLFGSIHGLLQNRYSYGPVNVGDSVAVKLAEIEGGADALAQVQVMEHEGMRAGIEARVVLPAERAMWLRLRPGVEGLLMLRNHGNESYPIVNVGLPERPASRQVNIGDLTVEVFYPYRDWWGMRHGWLAYMFAACTLSAVPLSRLMGVRF